MHVSGQLGHLSHLFFRGEGVFDFEFRFVLKPLLYLYASIYANLVTFVTLVTSFGGWGEVAGLILNSGLF